MHICKHVLYLYIKCARKLLDDPIMLGWIGLCFKPAFPSQEKAWQWRKRSSGTRKQTEQVRCDAEWDWSAAGGDQRTAGGREKWRRTCESSHEGQRRVRQATETLFSTHYQLCIGKSIRLLIGVYERDSGPHSYVLVSLCLPTALPQRECSDYGENKLKGLRWHTPHRLLWIWVQFDCTNSSALNC